MSNVVILPVIKIERRAAPPPEGSVVSIPIGPQSHVCVRAFTADEMLVPLVELRTPEGVTNLTVEQARVIGALLIVAADKAMGTPTA